MSLPQPAAAGRHYDPSYGTLSPIIALACADLLFQFGEAADVPAWAGWARYLRHYGEQWQPSELICEEDGSEGDEEEEARDAWGDLTPWVVAVLCVGGLILTVLCLGVALIVLLLAPAFAH